MEKKKRQHYVPQFYLRNFVREDNCFTILNIKAEKIIENVPYQKQCYEDYYYGNDEIWENKLGKIENDAALIIAKINEQSCYYPKGKEIINLTNENEVKMLNVFQLIVAKEIVYFQDRNQAELIISLYKNNMEKKKLFEELGRPQKLGTETNKIINYPQPFIPIDCNFSFGKVHPKGKGFIENEIDWFPRQKDEVYENRMKMKPQLFKNLPLLKGRFSKKNIKNIERFNKFVYDYWNDKL